MRDVTTDAGAEMRPGLVGQPGSPGRTVTAVPQQPEFRLSFWLAAVLVLQAAGGFFIEGLYRDNAWVVSVLRGTDLQTLLLDVPLLIGATLLARRGSLRARLVLAGTLYYVLYNNVYYLFSSFNRFFLVYVAVAILSGAAFAATLLGEDTRRLARSSGPAPRRLVCATLVGCAGILAVMWIGQALQYLFDGRVPKLITDTGGVTNVVAILDLTMVVPLLLLGADWLWRGRPWGRVVAGAMLVQCTLITADLVFTPPFQAAAGVEDAWTLVPLWAAMGLAFLVSTVALLRSIKEEA